MLRERIIELLGSDWDAVQECIVTSLRSDVGLVNLTNAAVLCHGGKQMRPMLSLLMARATSPDGRANSDSVRFAVASELLHNATLMHDDVADDSKRRRGAPSVMSMLGSGGAVLLGDYWLVKAVQEVLKAGVSSDVLNLFAETLKNLSEGELLQLQKASSCDTTEDDYLRIIYCKTASLFEAACLSGAISVGADPQKREAAKNYARALGIAFQIKDDIFDYSASDSIGKPVGSDLKEQKITLPLLGAIKNTGRGDEIRKMVSEIPSKPEIVAELTGFVRTSGGLEYAKTQLDAYILKAVESLECIPDSAEKEILCELARYNAIREI